MEAWFASVCQVFGTEFGVVVGMICVAVAVLLLALIVLGFGPLRTWLGLSNSNAGRPLRGYLDPATAELRGIWQLYRELGRAALNQR
jgi:hypothetical protein